MACEEAATHAIATRGRDAAAVCRGGAPSAPGSALLDENNTGSEAGGGHCLGRVKVERHHALRCIGTGAGVDEPSEGGALKRRIDDLEKRIEVFRRQDGGVVDGHGNVVGIVDGKGQLHRTAFHLRREGVGQRCDVFKAAFHWSARQHQLQGLAVGKRRGLL